MDMQTAAADAAQIGADTEKQRAKLGRWLIAACWLVYVGSFLTKMLYSVELVEIIAELGISKAQGGVPLTCYYVTYGVAQVLFALLIQRVNVRKFFVWSIGASAVVFVLGSVFFSLPALMVIYALIGILQCCSWGGLLHLITLYIHPDKQAFAVGFLCTGYSVSNLLAYFMSYAALAIGSWKYAFWFGGAFLLLSVVFFNVIVRRAEKTIPPNVHPAPAAEETPSEGKKKHRYSSGCILYLTLCIIGCLLVTALYNAGANYLPMLLVEVHGMPSQYSFLISTLMPVFVTVGPFLVTAACKRKGTFISRAALFLLGAAVLLPIFILCHDKNIFLTVLVSALYAMVIRGVAAGYISIAPLHMDDEMGAGAFSSIANVGGSVAAAATPVVFGFMLDHWGWVPSYWALLAVTVFMAVLHIATMFLLQHPRHRIKKKNTHRYNHRLAHKHTHKK